MRQKQICEVIPFEAPDECPYNCIGCKHLIGVIYNHGQNDIEVVCDLDEEE